MKIHTEKEAFLQSQHFAFRLRNLYKNDLKLFNQVVDYLPFPVYINHRKTLEYKHFSKTFFSRGKEIEDLYLIGSAYLDKISNLKFLEIAKNKAKAFDELDDFDATCSYLQIIKLNKEFTPFFTHKIFLDDRLTLNNTLFPKEIEPLQNVFKELFGEHFNEVDTFLRLQQLTKTEKKIMKLLANGYSVKQISEICCTSFHTVHTHKRNIYQKLAISKLTDLLKFVISLELIKE